MQSQDKEKLPKTDNRVRRLPGFSTTRWTSHHRATETIFKRYDQLLSTFEKITEMETNREAASESETYSEKLRSFPFVLTLLVVNTVFEITTPLSKYLQTKNIDFIQAYDMVKVSLEKIKKIRNEKSYDKFIKKAEEFAEEHETEIDFPVKRISVKKRQADETGNDERPKNEKDRYRVECYYVLLDTIVSALEERFSTNIEGIFSEISLLKEDRLINLIEGTRHF